MKGWRAAEVSLDGLSTAIISFILTGWLYIAWLGWRYPGDNAQGDIGAFFLAIYVSPVCSLICMAVSFLTTKKKYSN
jgi:hypothetical protein